MHRATSGQQSGAIEEERERVAEQKTEPLQRDGQGYQRWTGLPVMDRATRDIQSREMHRATSDRQSREMHRATSDRQSREIEQERAAQKKT